MGVGMMSNDERLHSKTEGSKRHVTLGHTLGSSDRNNSEPVSGLVVTPEARDLVRLT